MGAGLSAVKEFTAGGYGNHSTLDARPKLAVYLLSGELMQTTCAAQSMNPDIE